jgi:hypothetical protein
MTSSSQIFSSRRAVRLALVAGAVALFTLCLPYNAGMTGSWTGTAVAATAAGGPAGKSVSDRAGKGERGKADRGDRGRRGRDRDRGDWRDHDGRGGHGGRGGHDGWGRDGGRHGHGGWGHGHGWGRGDVDETPTVSEPETPATPTGVRSEMRNNPDELVIRKGAPK